jgi:hypothetical protein
MKQQQALSVLILGLFFVQQAVAWFSVPPSAMVLRSSPSVSLRATAGDNDVKDSDEDDAEEVWHPDSTHPCWQNLLDDDCSMSTVYSSNFVAGKWLKSMPCGEGIQVRARREAATYPCLDLVPAPGGCFSTLCEKLSLLLFRLITRDC